ncbi:MAG: electron transfer flavoprotein subunit alpha/FixB family protein [Pseudomonadota bacterium]
MEQNSEVWVYLQHQGNDLVEPSLEILGKARELAGQLKVPVAGVLAGERVDLLANKVLAYGANKVYVLQSRHLENYTTHTYAKALYNLVRTKSPAIVLMAATPQGRDLAPRIASALRVGLTADCTDLRIGSYLDPKTKKTYHNILLQIRPAWGGNIIATIVNPETRPQMATVREGIMKLPEQSHTAGRGDIIHVPPAVTAEDIKTAVLKRELVEKTLNLKGAGIIVAGGAGAATKEGFGLIRQLAHALGAEVGATRAAVDAGVIGHEHQVGQTGITVRPKLYIACGISGAVQHLAGMSEAKKIIAINTDPEAAIFGVAHYGIIGEVRDVIPKLISSYKTLSH